jgi:hypothetical protein
VKVTSVEPVECAIGHCGERHLGFVLVVRDARDELAFHVVNLLFAYDQSAGLAFAIHIDERGQHLDADALFHG